MVATPGLVRTCRSAPTPTTLHSTTAPLRASTTDHHPTDLLTVTATARPDTDRTVTVLPVVMDRALRPAITSRPITAGVMATMTGDEGTTTTMAAVTGARVGVVAAGEGVACNG